MEAWYTDVEMRLVQVVDKLKAEMRLIEKMARLTEEMVWPTEQHN